MRIACAAAFLFLVLVLLVEDTVARGGRGGRGGGGGGGGGSGGGSSRGSSYTRTRSTSNKRYGGYSKAIAAGLVVSGMTRYRQRYYNTKYYKKNPPLCYTTNAGTLDNGTATLSLGYFVCPYKEEDIVSDSYCCGPRDRQYCCGYWGEPGRAAGAIIGIILGVATGAILIVCAVRCYRRKKTSKSSIPNVSYSKPGYSDSGPDSMPQPSQYSSGPAPPYDSGSAPPPYPVNYAPPHPVKPDEQ